MAYTRVTLLTVLKGEYDLSVRNIYHCHHYILSPPLESTHSAYMEFQACAVDYKSLGNNVID